MPGFTTYKNITLENITQIANVSEYPEFMISVNHTVYAGWLYFILLWVVWFILFKKAQDRNDDLLVNAMVSFAAVTLVSFFMRAITMIRYGVIEGLLTDHQMWVFPILTIVLATIISSQKQD